MLRISRRSFSFFSNKINKTSSNKSTCKSSSREIEGNGPRFPVRKIKVRLLPNLFLARAYCYFYSRLIIIVPLVDKSGHSISFILHLFMSSCSKIGNLKKKEENLPSPLPASSQYSGNDAVVFFSLEQVLENFRKKKILEKYFLR